MSFWKRFFGKKTPESAPPTPLHPSPSPTGNVPSSTVANASGRRLPSSQGWKTFENRVVRVFVSSTFKDMQAEREELVKFTFPELRRRCRERRVELVGVDLRWGITDEQTAEGKVLPICLAEIEGCRPYFIGLLGERYGWVPRSIDDDLTHREPWLKEHREKSVTELEILHGVLNDPDMKGLAFFYFRSKQASDAIEQRLSKEPAYMPEPEASRVKLNILKQKIETSTYPLKKDYPDAKTLGQLVLDDLWSTIEKRYPIEEVPTELEQRRIGHDAFASFRRKVYIGRKDYYDRLNEHAAGDGPPLVVLGESGSGKSALLANWAYTYQQEHPEEFMVCHYIGSTADSGDHMAILRRIMEEIQRECEPETKKEEGIFGISEEENAIPTDPKKAMEAFPLWLARAAARGRFILILDALNQLEDRDNAPDLGWLPNYFPPNVRVMLSTLPGRSLDALKKRTWPEMIVGPMEKTAQEQYIIEYLKQYGKELNLAQRRMILEEEQASNPLYLRTLLDEFRVFGVYQDLEKEIEHYLQATTVDKLFTLVLERLEKDYEKERKGFVREVTTLIWASRRGLSETELLELLGTSENPMPRAFWSPLYLALEDSLVSRSGLLTFFHDFLKKAVESRYLPAPGDKKRTHLTMADYFDKRPLDDRKVDELPWQLYQVESLPRLKDCITDMDMFLRLTTEAKQYELSRYWLAMGTQYDIVEGCNEMIARYESTSPDESDLAFKLNEIASFLYVNGRYDGAEPLHRRALAIYEKVLGPEHPNTVNAVNDFGRLLYTKGDYDGAEPLLRRALATYEKVLGPEHPNTVFPFDDLAVLLRSKGDYNGAEALCRRALAIREKVLGTEHPKTSVSLNNLAHLLYMKGDYDGAEPLLRRALAIDEKVLGTEHPDFASCLTGLAELLRIKGDYTGAEPLYRRALAITEKVEGTEHPNTAISLNNLAALLWNRGDYDGAEPLWWRALAIDEKVLGAEHPYTALFLSNLAALLCDRGDYDGAEPLCRRALAIREKVLGPEHPYTATSLNNLAYLFHMKGDYNGAEPLFRRALAIDEKVLGTEHPDVATSLNNLAGLLHGKGDYAGAEPLYRRALAIEEKVLGPDHPETAKGINNLLSLALLVRDKGEHPRAAAIFRHLIETFESTRLSYPDMLNSLALCHNELAFHTSVPAMNWKEAEYHYKKAVEFFGKIPDQIEAANAELNLQTMYHLSGRKVDLERVKELIRILEDAGSPKAEKGRRLLNGSVN